MAKKCFLSFHYKADNWRVSQVRNMGVIEEQPLLAANDWESIKKKGDKAIEEWIDKHMAGKKCLVVLVGEKTAGRPWVKYEIKKAWKDGMGVVGVRIHGLKDADEKQSKIGGDPFAGLTVDGKAVAGVVHDTPYSTSTNVYDYIKKNLDDWVDAAIKARK
ncbi:TIR domain-containing protein [Sphingomonas faeni]|uniref:TIR domain-containing protein n=1 Tax=Sphingomonas faeni TaxID=185950 RepID=UPI002786C8A7|nr:TIR domain-containing protein [Sphingomonas faeni]MDQ0836959.1 hypothetical protein [Sphingomonas faeni]